MSATPGCTLTFKLTDLSGAGIAGKVILTLVNFGSLVPTVPSNDVIAGLSYTVLAASDGTGSVTFWGNYQLNAVSSFYQIQIFGVDSNGNASNTPNVCGAYQFNSSGTFDLSSLTPQTVYPGAQPPLGVPGPTGSTGATGPSGSSNIPWIDIQNFGGIPKPSASVGSTTTATTVSGSPDVTVNSALTYFTNGAGVCIWKAGNAPATAMQSAPTAPTVKCPAVSGSGSAGATQTIKYACVSVDAMGGLSPASSATSATTPAVFSCPPVQLSSISQTSNVVTVNFDAPLNATVAAGMTVHITGVTGVTALNGVWPIATAPSTSQITFALSGNAGSGTVSVSSIGRLSNSQVITAISRNAAGVITITTAADHNWTTQTGLNPTVVIVEGISPVDLNGHFVIATASGTSVTCATGILNTPETGTVTAGASAATVWEFNTVSCPQQASLSDPCIAYYIYSDSANPGGALTLIGKTLYRQHNFVDYGPWYGGGYVAPAYVPTTAPVSYQNQLFASTILSGAGTKNLVLAANVPTSIAALGATIMYDDAPCLTLALAERSQGNVCLTPDVHAAAFTKYVFNSPVTVPVDLGLIVATGIKINETLSFPNANGMYAPLGVTYTETPQFSQRAYVSIGGIGNPQILASTSFSMDGLGLTSQYNGQNNVMIQGFYSQVTNCSFVANSDGTSVPLIYQGSCTSARLANCNFQGASVVTGATTALGGFGPPVPALWLKASDNIYDANAGVGTAQFSMEGANTGSGRTILFDAQYADVNGGFEAISIGSTLWWQQANQPTVMFWGGFVLDAWIRGVVNDTSVAAICANWVTNGFYFLRLGPSYNSLGYPFVTGRPIKQIVADTYTPVSGGAQRVGAASLTTTAATSDTINILGATTASHVSITPTNAAAATDMGAGNVYVSTKATNAITLVHSATSGMTFDLLVTEN